jgi:hypothetical protein
MDWSGWFKIRTVAGPPEDSQGWGNGAVRLVDRVQTSSDPTPSEGGSRRAGIDQFRRKVRRLAEGQGRAGLPGSGVCDIAVSS